jgi:hypothetical protein
MQTKAPQKASSIVFFYTLSLFFILSVLHSFALSQNLKEVPDTLKPWIPWIQLKEEVCPWNQERVCAFPGKIQYKIPESNNSTQNNHSEEEEATNFKLTAHAVYKSWVSLPFQPHGPPPFNLKFVDVATGLPLYLPLNLQINKLEVLIPSNSEVEISGSLLLGSNPQELPLPAGIGLTEVIGGTPNARFERTNKGGAELLRLLSQQNLGEKDAVTARVFHRIEDGSPLKILSVVLLSVSGKARLLHLGRITPDNSIPVSATYPLEYNLDMNGNIAVQIVPGEHTLTISSVIKQPVSTLSFSKNALPFWPTKQVLLWQPSEDYRIVEFSGALATKIEEQDLPPLLQQASLNKASERSTWLADVPVTLNLKPIRKGESRLKQDTITLTRDLWIDVADTGFTVRDSLRGVLDTNNFITSSFPLVIGRASLNNQEVVISEKKNDKVPNGVQSIEIRDREMQLSAVGRIENTRSIPLSGWSAEIDRLYTTLHLPPSWKLFHASGSRDSANSQSWVDSWSLMTLFTGFLVVVASNRIFGRLIASLTLIGIVLFHQEFSAPLTLFVELILFCILFKVLKSTRLKIPLQVCTVATFFVWAIQALTFSKLQFTQALYPQLQSGSRYPTVLQEFLSAIESFPLTWPTLLVVFTIVWCCLKWTYEAQSLFIRIVRFMVSGTCVVILCFVLLAFSAITFSSYSSAPYAAAPQVAFQESVQLDSNMLSRSSPKRAISKSKMADYDAEEPLVGDKKSHPLENSQIVAGPSLPAWNWKSHTFSVTGPILPTDTINFYFITPPVSRLLSLLRVLLALFGLILVGKQLKNILVNEDAASSSLPNTTVVTTLIAGLMIFGFSPLSQAQFPPSDVLNDLHSRLSSVVCKENPCTTIEHAQVSLTDTKIKISLKVLSNGESVVTLPGPLSIFSPYSVTLNNKDFTTLAVSSENFLLAKTSGGLNEFILTAELPDPSDFSLTFHPSHKPIFIETVSPGWMVKGVARSGQNEQTIRFIKESSDNKNISLHVDSAHEGLKPWVTIKREIEVGENVRIKTTLFNTGAGEKEVLVNVPLFDNEQLNTKLAVFQKSDTKKRIAQVTLAPNQKQLTFQTSLPFSENLKFPATTEQNSNMVFSVSCARYLSCNVDGSNPTSSYSGNKKLWTWHPTNEDVIQLRAVPIKGISGESLAVDSVRHDLSLFEKKGNGNLSISLRSTQQSPFWLKLPANVSVVNATLDQKPNANSEQPNHYSWLVNPGEHSINLEYRITDQKVPRIELSHSSHNIYTTVTTDPQRWILFLGGSMWGPAVLFWPKLLILLLLCCFLARLGTIEINQGAALVLGIVLATMPIYQSAIVLLWLAFLTHYSYINSKLRSQHYNLAFLSPALLIALTVLSVALFYGAVNENLTGKPPMLIAGNVSTSDQLKWFTDHGAKVLAQPWTITAPLWAWRVVALICATWVVLFTIRLMQKIILLLKKS